MHKQVVISYSSKDRESAEKICELLEKNGINCWIAPRDIVPCPDYAEAILSAIESSYAMVLILSENANQSIHVKHEVERAVSKGKTVFPIRIREVLPSGALELYISSSQWIDAFCPPLEAKIGQLSAVIKELIEQNSTISTISHPKRSEFKSRPLRYRWWIYSIIPLALFSITIIAALIARKIIFNGGNKIKTSVEFPVWTEAESAGNLYSPYGLMGETSAIRLDQTCSIHPLSGNTCIQIRYSPDRQDSWAGVYWQYPINNWGDDLGYDLSGATRLTFWARGEIGGEKAEFKVGGIKDKTKPECDSFGPLSTGIVTLEKEWKLYSINVQGQDLSNVIGGFCWVTDRFQNPTGCTIYIDEIKYE